MGRNETIPAPSDRPWGYAHDLLRLRTSRARQFIDVTDRVADSVRRSGVTHGLVAVRPPRAGSAPAPGAACRG